MAVWLVYIGFLGVFMVLCAAVEWLVPDRWVDKLVRRIRKEGGGRWRDT